MTDQDEDKSLKCLKCSLSVFLLEQDYNHHDQLALLQKGKLLSVLFSKFKNNRLEIRIGKEVIQLDYEMNIYQWYSVHLIIGEGYLKVRIETNREIVLDKEWLSLVAPLKEMKECHFPIIIPPKVKDMACFKGIVKDLYYHFSSEDNFSQQAATHMVSSFPKTDLSSRPLKIISEPIYSIEQFKYFNVEKDHLNTCKIKLQKRKTSNNGRRVIMCHDMNGGYLSDKHIQGSDSFLVYNFTYWQYVDIFIYFSHHRYVC